MSMEFLMVLAQTIVFYECHFTALDGVIMLQWLHKHWRPKRPSCLSILSSIWAFYFVSAVWKVGRESGTVCRGRGWGQLHILGQNIVAGSFDRKCHADDQCDQKKSPNVYKSCPKMISLEKDRFWHLYKNCQRMRGIGQIVKGFKKLPKVW